MFVFYTALIFLFCSPAHGMSHQETKIAHAHEQEEKIYASISQSALAWQLSVALGRDDYEKVKLLLPYYREENFLANHINDFHMNDSLLIRTLVTSGTYTNYENKIQNILLLLSAGASPFKQKYHHSSSFKKQLVLCADIWDALNDQRIWNAIDQSLVRELDRAVCCQAAADFLNSPEYFDGAAPALMGIIQEYLFDQYILDEDEPKTVHFLAEPAVSKI